MRCLNCGWENASSAVRCIKCNIPLQPNMGAAEQPAANPSPAHSPDAISGTIVTDRVNLPAWDEPSPSPIDRAEPPLGSPSNCPHCSYPLASNSETCPSCHKPVVAKRQPAAQPEQPDFKGTIDPYRASKGNSFSLTVVARENEQHSREVLFKGEEANLNRENIDPGNNSITSKVQAVIKLIDGDWCILDESEKQTTFIRPSSPIKLKKGDVILLGDRKVIFNG